MPSIKDLIYFDFDKAKSLNSQLNGGIINETTREIENETGMTSELGVNVKIFNAKIGGSDKGRQLEQKGANFIMSY